ncbi:hypothetical protein [Nitratireductor aestuarii]|uniref:hypothetical protein n=1 Tax=Nitratireductor aestuarii TaxID=1735103 RepID=UPI00166323FC|nr:hypothetical protein [Nitratireductor aestuarii]
MSGSREAFQARGELAFTLPRDPYRPLPFPEAGGGGQAQGQRFSLGPAVDLAAQVGQLILAISIHLAFGLPSCRRTSGNRWP